MPNTLADGSNLFLQKNAVLPQWHKTPTGFPHLDEYLGGGFGAGIHCIGAIPSLGKSTFVMQMAEHMAESKPVVVFSLEMDTANLGAKAVSRCLFLHCQDDLYYAKTPTDLMNPKITHKYSAEEWSAITEAAEDISEINKNIEIVECDKAPCNVRYIRQYMDAWVEQHNEIPIVIIDYLQILAPVGTSYTDKQNADKNLEALKYLSKTHNMPVILVSSFNRENYDMEVSIRSFKDSGNIEYSCDTVIGMQFSGMKGPKFDINKARQASPRDVELVILKQKNGISGVAVAFDFYAEYSYFKEKSPHGSGIDIDYSLPCR